MSLFGGKRRGENSLFETPETPIRDDSNDRPSEQTRGTTAAPPSPTAPPLKERGDMANIGKSISIRGDLAGEEDLVIEGKVEGKVDLPNNELTIGANGNVRAELHAKAILVIGRVAGNVSASERIEIQATGIVEGDVRAPRLVVQEGAVLNGSIEMSTKESAAKPTVSSSKAAGSVVGSAAGAEVRPSP